MKRFFTCSLFLVLYCSVLNSYAQSKDTIIIIRLGDSQMFSEALNVKVKEINAGSNFLNVLDEYGHLTTWVDLNAYYIEVPAISDKLQSIKSGDIHSVVLYSDSTLNQFFVSSRIQMFYPSRFRSVVSIASGSKMSVAINKKHIMYAWGPLDMVKKLQIPIKTYGVKVAAVGKNHIAFINIKNRVFVWGDHSANKNKIPVFNSTPVQITCGDHHSMVLDKNGNVYAWGSNLVGQCNVPKFPVKAVAIDAKMNRNLAVLENNEVHVWGMNEHLTFNYAGLGTVKQAVVGNNYVAILVSSDQQRIVAFQKTKPVISIERTDLILAQEKSDTLLLQAKDSLLRTMLIPTDSNYLANYFYENYENSGFYQMENNNRINFEADQSYFDHINSSTQFYFEGSNNEITVINKSVNSKRTNVNHMVVVKGSGKKITIVNEGNEEVIGQDLLTVIDLDEKGQENIYPEEYIDKVQDQVIDPNLIEFIDFNTLPNSLITEMPVSDGEYWANGEYVSEAGDCKTIMFEAGIWSDSFEGAQAFFHCKQPEKGLQRLMEEDAQYCDRCKLALFEIYYYGLFGYAPDLTKANKYYNEYLRIVR